MSSTSWKNEINYPDYECPKCKQSKCWFIGFYTDAGGAPKYPFVCFNCGHRTQHFVKRKIVQNSGIEPKILDPKIPPYFCEVCNSEGAQNHHWAPWALFGNEANSWPQSYLCQTCHQKWHNIVTPNINGIKKA